MEMTATLIIYKYRTCGSFQNLKMKNTGGITNDVDYIENHSWISFYTLFM